MRSGPLRALSASTFFFVVLLLVPMAARAEVRAGVGNDGRDVPESLSGPREPDIERVHVSYNTTGSLAVTVRVFEPWTATTQEYPYFRLRLGSTHEPYEASQYWCASNVEGDATLRGLIDPNRLAESELTLYGYAGELPVNASVSTDGLETTFTVSAAQLAGRNYICVEGMALYRPDPWGHCWPSLDNCRDIRFEYYGDWVDEFFFPGLTPPKPACDDGIDNDDDGKADYPGDSNCYWRSGTSEGPLRSACNNNRDDDGDGDIDRQDPGCRGKVNGGSEVDPQPVSSSVRLAARTVRRNCLLRIRVKAAPVLKPVKLFPFSKVKLRVRGVAGRARGDKRDRRLQVGKHYGRRYMTLKVKPGRYRVAVRYLGDTYRRASKAQAQRVTVCRAKNRRRR